MVEKMDEMKAILLKMKEETLQEINKTLKSGSDITSGEPSGDIYDQASSERDRELGLLLGDRDREKLRSIDEALLKIEEGEYGICDECEEDIPIGRLKVVPFAHYSVKCKADIESSRPRQHASRKTGYHREIALARGRRNLERLLVSRIMKEALPAAARLFVLWDIMSRVCHSCILFWMTSGETSN